MSNGEQRSWFSVSRVLLLIAVIIFCIVGYESKTLLPWGFGAFAASFLVP